MYVVFLLAKLFFSRKDVSSKCVISLKCKALLQTFVLQQLIAFFYSFFASPATELQAGAT